MCSSSVAPPLKGCGWLPLKGFKTSLDVIGRASFLLPLHASSRLEGEGCCGASGSGLKLTHNEEKGQGRRSPNTAVNTYNNH